MNWLVLALVNIVSISIGNLYQRKAMQAEDSDPIGYAIVFQFLLGFAVLLFAMVVGFKLPPIATYPLNFALSAVFYGIGTLCMFQAAKLIEASELTIIAALGSMVTIIASVIVLHENFSLQQALGVLLIFIAIIMVQKKRSLKLDRGAWWGVVGTCLFGLAVVSDVFVIKHFDPVSYAVAMCFMPGILLLCLFPRKIKVFKPIVSSGRNLFIFVFLYAIQVISYYAALGLGANASQLSPITRAQIILTVLLSAIFLRERDRLWLKLGAAILTTAGVLLIT